MLSQSKLISIEKYKVLGKWVDTIVLPPISQMFCFYIIAKTFK